MEQNKWKVEIKASNMEKIEKHQDYIYLKKEK